jgi:PII-like signaling protein
MVTKKMSCLTIRIKKNDEYHGKKLERALIDFLVESGVSGATVWTGVDGFGKRGTSSVHLEGLTVNMPLMIEVVEERSKLDPLLTKIRNIVGDNGLVTYHEVEVI